MNYRIKIYYILYNSNILLFFFEFITVVNPEVFEKYLFEASDIFFSNNSGFIKDIP